MRAEVRDALALLPGQHPPTTAGATGAVLAVDPEIPARAARGVAHRPQRVVQQQFPGQPHGLLGVHGRHRGPRGDAEQKAQLRLEDVADAGPWAEPKEQPPLSTEASDPKQLVRPYTRTGGRTHAGYRLELETLLSTPLGRDRDIATLRDDYQKICEMCRMPQSVAEIAARLGLPLGAARVLIADLVPAELLYVHEVAEEDGPSMDLLSRVASGLRRL